MKRVIVMAVAVGLLAAPAFAGIKNTKHDLSSSNANSATYVGSSNVDEICVFCHTPHGGVQAGYAPLWNRSKTADFSAMAFYNSASLDQTNSAPNVVDTAIAGSDAPLCFSCHDGTTALQDGLLNSPNSLAGAAIAWNGNALSADATIGADLTNDHPIGMDYSAVASNGVDEFNAETDATKVNASGSVKLFDGGVMWCSSCHDVHNNAAAPFLATTNAGSKLCLVCHNK